MEKEEKTQNGPSSAVEEPKSAERTDEANSKDASRGDSAETNEEEISTSEEKGTAESLSREPGADEKKKGLFARGKDKLVHWKNALFDAINERSAEIKHAKAKRIVVGVAIALIAVFFIVFYFLVGKKIALFINKPEEFRAWLESFDKGSIVIFIFLRVVQTVLKLIPGEALEIAAGCAFGVWGGLLWCSVGSIIGSLIIIFLGKRYGMKLVGLFVSPEKMQSISFLKNKKRLNFTFFLLYFIPGTPKDMFTWLVCLTDENVFLFVLITAIARIPSIVTSTWCGQELVNANYPLSIGIFAATIALSVIGGLIYKLVLGKRKNKEATENGGKPSDESAKK